MWKLWLCAGVVTLAGRAAWGTEYVLQEFGVPTDRQTRGYGLNDADQALIGVFDPGNTVSELYSGGVLQPVGPGGGVTGWSGVALDDAGDMVGQAPVGYGAGETYVYSGGVWTDVKGSAQLEFRANAIVPAPGGGAVAGGRTFLNSGNMAMVVRDGQLEAVPGYDGVVAGNASGDLLLGGGATGMALMHADGMITPVDTGLPASEVSPVALTPKGAILGLRPGTATNGGVRSFVYAGGKLTYLPTEVDGLGETVFWDMNDAGMAVGAAEYGSPYQQTAAIYEDGQAHLLEDVVENAEGWHFDNAEYVNADGWILGHGTDPSGALRAFLLTPVDEGGPGVPEPLSVLLLPLGLAGLWGRGRYLRRWS
ncbi:MAG TPA: hypothetical protein VH253_18950 [Phycisphaerae bacterium]|nr:hypothetical protein [Phycisphaerae bacterium]